MRESGVGNGRKLLEPASEVEYMTVEIGEWNDEWERERERVLVLDLWWFCVLVGAIL